MSNDFEIEKVQSVNYEKMRNLLNENINSAAIQTARDAGLFYNKGLYENMLSMVKKDNELRSLNYDYYEENREKFVKNTHSKYNKFVNFIKQRHFKSYSGKLKKFRPLSPELFFDANFHQLQKISEAKKINSGNSLFLTQDSKKKPKQENKLLLLYKKIFNNGLDEAKVYNNIKLVPLIENDIHEAKNSFDYDENREIEIITGNNFHPILGNPKETHNSHLMQKREFLNFRTNPKLKKGRKLLNRQASSGGFDEKIKIGGENSEDIFYRTTNLPKLPFDDLKPENYTVLLRTNYSNNTNKTAPNPFKREKSKNVEKIKKIKIDSNLMTVNENQIMNALNSKKGTAINTSRQNANKDDREIPSTDRLTSSVFQLSNSQSKNPKLTKNELTNIIKIKQNKFNVLKKKVFNKKSDKRLDVFENIKNSDIKMLKCESLNTPFLAIDKKRRQPTVVVKKETNNSSRYEENFKARKMTKALYNIFDKDEVDFVLKQNKYKLNM